MPKFDVHKGRGIYKDYSSTQQMDASMQNMMQTTMASKKMVLDKALKDEAWFLDMTDMDRAEVMDQANTDNQSKDDTEFNDAASKIYKEHKGQLTTKAKQEIMKLRRSWEASTGARAKESEWHRREAEMMEKDYGVGNYDREYWDEANANYWKGEGWKKSGIRLYGADPYKFFEKNYSPAGPRVPGVRDVPGSTTLESTFSYNPEVPGSDPIGDVFKADNTMQGITGLGKWFREKSIDEQNEWFDWAEEDNIPGQNPEETRNAILEAARNDPKFQALVRGEKVDRPRKKAVVAGKEFDSKSPINSGNNKNSTYDISRNKSFGVGKYKKTYNSYLNLGQLNKTTGPQRVGEYTNLDTGVTGTLNKAIRFYVAGYDVIKDEVIISPKEDAYTDAGGEMDKDTNYAIPAKDFDDMLKRLFSVDRTSLMKGYTPTVGELDDM